MHSIISRQGLQMLGSITMSATKVLNVKVCSWDIQSASSSNRSWSELSKLRIVDREVWQFLFMSSPIMSFLLLKPWQRGVGACSSIKGIGPVQVGPIVGEPELWRVRISFQVAICIRLKKLKMQNVVLFIAVHLIYKLCEELITHQIF